MALKMLVVWSTCSNLRSELNSLANNVPERAWISNTFEPVNKETE